MGNTPRQRGRTGLAVGALNGVSVIKEREAGPLSPIGRPLSATIFGHLFPMLKWLCPRNAAKPQAVATAVRGASLLLVFDPTFWAKRLG
jgi:hypothetical protein